MNKQEFDTIYKEFINMTSNKDGFWKDYGQLLEKYALDIDAMIYMAGHDGQLSEMTSDVIEDNLNLTRYEYRFLTENKSPMDKKMDCFYNTMARFRYCLMTFKVEEVKPLITCGVALGLEEFETMNKENNNKLIEVINNRRAEIPKEIVIASDYIDEMVKIFTMSKEDAGELLLNELINKLTKKVDDISQAMSEGDAAYGCGQCSHDDECARFYCQHFISNMGANRRYDAAYSLLTKIRNIKKDQSLASTNIGDIKKEFGSMYSDKQSIEDINQLFKQVENADVLKGFNYEGLEKFLIKKQLLNADEILFELEAKANKFKGEPNIYRIMIDRYSNYISDGIPVIDSSFLAFGKDDVSENDECNNNK